MNAGTLELLRKFGEEPIESVSLRKEEIAFTFVGGYLTCVRPPTIRIEGADLAPWSPEWLHALWSAIGETPRDVAATEEMFSFGLGKYELSIDLLAPDHPSPEHVILSFGREGFIVL